MPQLVRRDIEQPLDHEHAVLPARAPIRRHDRQCREHRGEGAVIVRHHVGSEQRALAVDRDGQPVRIVGAGIMQEDVLDAKDAAFCASSAISASWIWPRSWVVATEMLEPVFDPFHRPLAAAIATHGTTTSSG